MARRLVASAAVLSVSAICSVAASAAVPGFGLQTLTLQEASESQAAGIGCSWSLPRERGMRFAAADDHAVVKLGGRLTRLRPRDGAKDAFPFTYDEWVGEGVSVTIARSSMRRDRGSGLLTGAAALRLARDGRIRVLAGRIECGD